MHVTTFTSGGIGNGTHVLYKEEFLAPGNLRKPKTGGGSCACSEPPSTRAVLCRLTSEAIDVEGSTANTYWKQNDKIIS